jgi:2',5'-phosphodiesterase
MKFLRRLFPFTVSSFDSLTRFGLAIMSPPPLLTIRVVSYNILSSHLADPQHFSTLNPDHLAADKRFPVILKKVQEEMDNSSIICLQEVSQDWAGPLHSFCANNGYHLVTGLYGKKFNGYMGVALAWPADKWRVLDVDISRLADRREGGWPRPPRTVSFSSRIWNTVVGTVRPFLERLGVLPKQAIDAWDMAGNRFNILITAKLEDKKTGRSFAIGNYHMPCVYYAPKVMTIHTDLAARHVQRLAGPSMPYVLAGDWNIKPDGSSYRLLTTGQMDVGDPEWPEPKHGMRWEPSAKPMRSAYGASDHGEPEFTNYARVKEQEPFIGTLDYIFLSPHWRVVGVKPLPPIAEAGGPFPNLDRGESSDHILIAADLVLE